MFRDQIEMPGRAVEAFQDAGCPHHINTALNDGRRRPGPSPPMPSLKRVESACCQRTLPVFASRQVTSSLSPRCSCVTAKPLTTANDPTPARSADARACAAQQARPVARRPDSDDLIAPPGPRNSGKSCGVVVARSTFSTTTSRVPQRLEPASAAESISTPFAALLRRSMIPASSVQI